MLHYFKFCSEVPAPAPARGAYHKRQPGKGWPEECPPMRAANSFGWDLLCPSDLEFSRHEGGWRLDTPVTLESDWDYAAAADGEGVPLTQENAWFWEQDQMLPHVITPEVYPEIENQVKVSTLLFMRTESDELLYFCDIPNLSRPFKVLSALVDTDWYPASYPWHCVLDLDPSAEKIRIARGDPLCRVFTVRREHYRAQEMSFDDFGSYFERSQKWLREYGRDGDSESLDITGTYGKQQQLSRFSVDP